jgi:two-component system, NtrC family, response regulator HydG
LIKNASILIVDDDADVLTAFRLLLKSKVKEVVAEKNPENILNHIKKNNFDLILLDMNFNAHVHTGNEGIYWLNKIKASGCTAKIIMITAYAEIEVAVRTLKEGANDFVIKPWQNDKLLETIQGLLEKSSGAEKKDKQAVNTDIIGRSDAMQAVFKTIEKIAPTDANVLILGENGTGKDLVAKAIHDQSLRKEKNYVKVDIGSLTESLFESELFGYKKGAFTDAREDRSGRFEAANNGTLFLDEIGNINLHQQSKLLSVLQNRMVIPLGSSQTIPVDIRLISATNMPLNELANESKFRKDLIYRINTIAITIPPLRERLEDVPILTDHFIKLYASKYFKSDISLNYKALDKLKNYHYPGNVRELQYTIERAVIMAESNEIQAADLFFSPIEISPNHTSVPTDVNLNQLEKKTILTVIEKNNGNISKAAKELGITRTALYRRLNKYDI